MNMDFKSAKELLDLCEENQLPISEVMRQRECILGEVPRDAVDHRMAKAWEIMHASATQPLKKPIKSMGGLIGGEAKKLETHYNKKKNICGDVLQKAMTYAMEVMAYDGSSCLIVAAPTAGSAGVVPGMMLALQECYRISDQRIVDALFNAGAVGYLAMRNATVAGAVGGCQAEVGIASAMAASAAVELMGGNPQQCLDAASTVLMNMLGLVCDPVGGLVEYPCQNRNAAGEASLPYRQYIQIPLPFPVPETCRIPNRRHDKRKEHSVYPTYVLYRQPHYTVSGKYILRYPHSLLWKRDCKSSAPALPLPYRSIYTSYTHGEPFHPESSMKQYNIRQSNVPLLSREYTHILWKQPRL